MSRRPEEYERNGSDRFNSASHTKLETSRMSVGRYHLGCFSNKAAASSEDTGLEK